MTDTREKWLCDVRGCDNEIPGDAESDDYREWERVRNLYADLLKYIAAYHRGLGYDVYHKEWFCIPCMRRIYPKWDRERREDIRKDEARQRARLARKAAARYAQTGFTETVFQLALRIQRGRCAACDVELSSLPSRAVHADHCHKTNTPRGVLCRDCNLAAGRLRDDPERCRRLAEYLENFPLELI